jgi:peptide/nickel transport system permease protein
MDFVLALPAIPLLIVLQSVAPRGVATMIVVLGLSRFPEVGRLARAACLGTLGQEYVLAARAAGAGATAIVVRHLLPQAASILLVAASLAFANTLIAESTLSFLGLGLPPEQPSWGTMLNNAQQSAMGGAWWTAFYPGLAIAVAVAAANALGDGLRDRLDPHARRSHQHVGGT